MIYTNMVYKSTFTNEMFLWHYMVLAPPNLVCESMSLIEIWELRATLSWREPPLESFILWYWLELGATCYAFMRKPPPKFLSLYVCLLEAHHSSHMPLGCFWPLGSATSMPFLWIFSVSLQIEIIYDSEGSLRYERWIYFMKSYHMILWISFIYD